MMNIPFPIIKIVIYKAPLNDVVFLFTGVMTPDGSYIQIQVACPIGEGEKWVFKTFKTMNYEVVLEGFEISAPA